MRYRRSIKKLRVYALMPIASWRRSELLNLIGYHQYQPHDRTDSWSRYVYRDANDANDANYPKYKSKLINLTKSH